MMSPTPLRLLAVLAFGVSLLSGCTPAPESTPTPSPAFTSDEEAFAAAEATYRAYVEASNDTDLSDPASFEDLFAWLRDDALTSAQENFSRFHAEGWKRAGDTSFDRFTPVSFDGESVTALLCVDASAVTLWDGDGNVVSSDRPDRQPVEVQLVAAPTTATRLAISSAAATRDLAC
ncbi:hypothetical protein AB0O70_00595 [Microbacterium paraoxydans]|uniref:hypothetical protein n=1 Tax=Microbacterium TaxID=33882 RepID=UPI00131A3B89|nr:hypothetical protein [Microbacterium sp. str. 'China']